LFSPQGIKITIKEKGPAQPERHRGAYAADAGGK
jgi:hypothetical protein